MITTARFEVTEWRALQKNTLQGFFALRLPSGMVIHDLTYHERSDGARWVGMPARSYKTDDGTVAYVRLIDFASKEAHQRFQELAKLALDLYFSTHADEDTPQAGKAVN